MEKQLELLLDTPFSLRFSIEEAMRIFIANYWQHKAFGKRSRAINEKILTFFKGYHLDTIAPGDIERLRRFYKDMGYSDAYINKIHMTLSRLYSWWYKTRKGKYLDGTDVSRLVLPEENPASQVSRVKEKPRKVQVTNDDRLVLWARAKSIPGMNDLADFLDVLWWSGQSPCDIRKIVASDVDLERKVIPGARNKTGIEYDIPIPDDRLEMVRRRMESVPPGKPIFHVNNEKPKWNVLRMMTNRSHIQMRDFRGGGVSFLLDLGMDLESIRKKYAWVDFSMIPIYDKRGDQKIRESTEELAKV